MAHSLKSYEKIGVELKFQLKLDCTDVTAIVTEPEMDPLSNQKAIDEVFFEEYGFNGLKRVTATNLVADRYAEAMAQKTGDGSVIVESGFR